ncbi:MAG: mandelate racemase/muconate lactonizing enzyme family protein [Thermoplasma sp.]|nr:MAG: mandelate racemase/muconate lactonizing enzyme family protein [Thermoplasma sp.]
MDMRPGGDGMKITEVRPYIVRNPWKKWVFIELETDDGSIGYGEATVFNGQFSVASRLKDVSRFILGKDPMKVRRLIGEWFVSTFNRAHDMVNVALISGVEAACWDLIGKHYGSPVYELLGGPVNDRIRVYANGWYTAINDVEDWAKAAKKVKERGYTALKFDPFGAGSGFLSNEEFKRSMEIIRAVHDEVGDDTEMLIEGHGRFNRSMALKIGKELERYDNIGWFEEPVIPEDVEGLTILSRSLRIPIAAGERFITRYDFVDPFVRGAIHIAQPDVINTGGIIETLVIGAMAEAHNIAMAPHQAEGPINTFITLNVDALMPNLKIQEMFDEFAYPSWAWDVVTGKPEVVNGYAKLPERPGIGIELKEKVRDYLATEKDPDFNLFSSGWEKRGFS